MVPGTDIRREQRRKQRRRQQLLRRAMFAAAGGLVAAAVLLVVWNALPAGADTQPTSAEALPDPRPVGAGNGIVVAIDAGHGGYNENNGCWDSGAKGNGVTEAELTIRIAGMLEELLRQDRRFAPVMTTDGSTYLKGSQRGAAAQAAGAELLVSIHFNSDPVYDSRGLECYPATPAMETNADSLRLAAAITEGFAATGLPLRGENGIRYLYFDANNNRMVYESSDTVPRTDPTFTVLETCSCPAVLVEQAFLTNPTDAAMFSNDEGCHSAAGIYYRAICRYFGMEPQ